MLHVVLVTTPYYCLLSYLFSPYCHICFLLIVIIACKSYIALHILSGILDKTCNDNRFGMIESIEFVLERARYNSRSRLGKTENYWILVGKSKGLLLLN